MRSPGGEGADHSDLDVRGPVAVDIALEDAGSEAQPAVDAGRLPRRSSGTLGCRRSRPVGIVPRQIDLSPCMRTNVTTSLLADCARSNLSVDDDRRRLRVH
jgi:hypothetical protein